MRLKHLLKKFEKAVGMIYGAVTSAAAKARGEQIVQARPGTFDGAYAAAINRDLKRSEREGAKKNTRGLPKGWGVHQARRAKLLARSRKHRAAATESQLKFAQDFLDAEKRCNKLRARLPRPREIATGLLAGRASQSFLSSVMPMWRKLNPSEIAAKVRYMLSMAKQTGRVPYRSPEKKPVMQRARVQHKTDGSMVVTPQPLPVAGV